LSNLLSKEFAMRDHCPEVETEATLMANSPSILKINGRIIDAT
jgi:hypothetical protein